MSTKTVRTYIITQDIIDLAIANNACAYVISWAKVSMNKSLTKEDIPASYGLWFSQYIEIDSKDIDYWIEKTPWAALQYVSDKLSPERLDWCAKKDPGFALRYTFDKLSPERLDWCAEKAPWAALMYASDKITSERLNWCIKQKPKYALKYMSDKLTLEQYKWCERQCN